ncbi:hypothetical protein WJX72_006863 [[Myrmecia] bisecta]|uniref:Uncharacterized protein n=1 Tax=[Myrmecia] bisecta TaxID=41462 RepID=A0AAW1PSL7_9CHLO
MSDRDFYDAFYGGITKIGLCPDADNHHKVTSHLEPIGCDDLHYAPMCQRNYARRADIMSSPAVQVGWQLQQAFSSVVCRTKENKS